MFKKKKGFTLIELLAVIVILGVIMLIAVPSVVEMIMKSKENSFLISAGRILDATSLKIGSEFNESTYENIDLSTLDYKGKRYDTGSIKVDNDSNLAVALWNPELKLCAYKDYNDKEIVIDRNRDLANCVIGVTELNLTSSDPEYSCITFDSATKTITKFASCPSIVRIPSKIDGVEVEYIGNNAIVSGSIDELNFSRASNLIGIGESLLQGYSLIYNIVDLDSATKLVSIGNSAFYNTNSGTNAPLKTIKFPSSLISIGECAFSDNALESTIVIPNSVKTIGIAAFSDNNISSVVIGNSVEDIGEGAFRDNKLTSVSIPNSVKTIGNYAFLNNNLVGLTLGNSLTNINFATFEGNDITSVVIPSSVTDIAERAFNGNNLTSVTIPNSVKTIGRDSFSYNALTSLTIPSSVTSIGISAFTNNQLPDDQAFIFQRNADGSIDNTTLVSYGGAKLSGVVIPSTVTNIGEGAFNYLKITSVTLPSSLTTIGDYAFDGNSLTTLTLPATLTSIGKKSFYKSSYSNAGLTSIIYKGTTPLRWDAAINYTTSTTSFVTGTVTNTYGNVVISAN